ncbi:MAG: LysM peptidoglycan-binding domain-containing protein [Treponema sp.]|nr:LysM peptidoglycan-binding domain-containing protein [Treponema sp.]
MASSLNRLVICILLSFFIAGFGFSEDTIHVMRPGDTIYSIAKSYGLSADEVLKYNKISDPAKVQAGTKIRIPGVQGSPAHSSTQSSSPAKTEPSRQDYIEYRVEKNDTLYSLARRYGISVSELLEINGFTSNYVIKAGEKIRVPALDSVQPSGQSETPNPSGQSVTTGSSQPVPDNSGNTTTTIKLDPAVKWPIRVKEIAQISGKLNGVQLTGERQESVKSLTGGMVVSAGPYRGFGRVAIVQTSAGYLYVYGGCETLSVKEGDKIATGSELGKLGIDTKTAKSQLFFFVYKGNTPVDPAKAPRA